MHRLNGYDSDQHTPYRNIDEDAGGSTAAVGSTNSLAVGSPDVGGLDALEIGRASCRERVLVAV